MFEFLKQKKLPFDEISQVLLSTANAIIQAGSADSDFDAATHGMAAVLPFVVETKRHFGIRMDPDSTFVRYIKFVLGLRISQKWLRIPAVKQELCWSVEMMEQE